MCLCLHAQCFNCLMFQSWWVHFKDVLGLFGGFISRTITLMFKCCLLMATKNWRRRKWAVSVSMLLFAPPREWKEIARVARAWKNLKEQPQLWQQPTRLAFSDRYLFKTKIPYKTKSSKFISFMVEIWIDISLSRNLPKSTWKCEWNLPSWGPYQDVHPDRNDFVWVDGTCFKELYWMYVNLLIYEEKTLWF